jgi:hypothetical protein
MELNHRILKTIPRQALDEIGDALGIRRHGVLAFDSEDMTSVMTDCCLYDWYEKGKNLVQRYAEPHPATPGTNESYLLQAYLHAKYRILMVQSAVPGARCSLPGRPQWWRVLLDGSRHEPKRSQRTCGIGHADHW